MRVFYTNSSLETCYYVRCLVPMQAAGWDGDKTSLRTPALNNEQKAQAVLDADVVVFHRPNDERSYEIGKKLKSMGKKIVSDGDDTYKELQTKWKEILAQVDGWVDKFNTEVADLVTCSTEFLAEEYRKSNPNVVVLPNCIDPDVWPDEPQRNEGPKVRIGLVGSVSVNGDFESMLQALWVLGQREDVQLVLFALPRKTDETVLAQKYYKEDYDFWDAMNVEWQPFVGRADYVDTLDDLKLDIIVIPRKDDYFNRCKSNLKFLEASALRIPCIAQGFHDMMSPYQVDPQDAEHMIIVTDNNKWLEEIDGLVKDKQKRIDMGNKAYDYVMDKYAIEKNIWRWEEAYKNLLNAQAPFNKNSKIDKSEN